MQKINHSIKCKLITEYANTKHLIDEGYCVVHVKVNFAWYRKYNGFTSCSVRESE